MTDGFCSDRIGVHGAEPEDTDSLIAWAESSYVPFPLPFFYVAVANVSSGLVSDGGLPGYASRKPTVRGPRDGPSRKKKGKS
jgi:hypothetical protein